MIQVAILGNVTYAAMPNAIFTHPLPAEGLNTLFSIFDATVPADTGSATRGHSRTKQTSRMSADL
jgi:hypothetical protein